MTQKGFQLITQEKLKSVLDYSPETGVFTWRKRMGRCKEGSVAGHKQNCGYLKVGLFGSEYSVHRLAWLYMFGEFPANQIDHINRIRTDNRINNLREVTHQQNCQNMKNESVKSASGFVGVVSSDKRFRARITVDSVQMHLGMFDTKEDAHRAYVEARKKFRPFFTQHAA